VLDASRVTEAAVTMNLGDLFNKVAEVRQIIATLRGKTMEQARSTIISLVETAIILCNI